ncbi:hypothetical protein CAEBREN_24497 [Caenorhabditis brenneri]|uniref:C-type lectin domain-containing protein n=1 Tax=Caenorhabditis brenneri TaxID=135651 RepID=G0N146_CAEBE|nr:hypothetical protein CAEBREN_24497 [Caenorhabditis brenneri]
MISKAVAVFLIFLVKFGVSDDPCPLNATLLHDNSCVKLFESPLRYQNASDVCKSLNGSLVSIHDSINDNALLLLAQSRYVVSPIWIGLSCIGIHREDCNWDDGTGSSAEYFHFASGNPSLQAGNNVYMLTSSYRAGQWVSVDGRLASFGYFCQFPPIVPLKFCPNLFNGYCYTLHTDELNEADARKVCQNDCGDLASIHSHEENVHINSLSPYGANAIDTARLGGRADQKVKTWFDGTPFNYTHFGHLESSRTCFAMNMVTNANLDAGQWESFDCDAKVPFVCKRAMSSTQC